MPVALFYLFSAIMIVFGLMVVGLRNPVSSALSLVVSFIGLAALYVSLNAYFIGVIQILVYAGAVMVLFLFIIMLMDIQEEQRRKIKPVPVIGGALLVVVFILQLVTVLNGFKPGERRISDVAPNFEVARAARAAAGKNVPSIEKDLAAGELPDTKLVGELLFTKYTTHLQIVGVLLLTATVGVVVLSRREDRPAAAKPGKTTPPTA